MKKKFIAIALVVSGISFINAQVGVGTTSPDTSAILEVKSTDKGVLLPNVSLSATNDPNIVNPATGLTVYNSAKKCLQTNLGTPSAPNWNCSGGVPTASKWFYAPAITIDLGSKTVGSSYTIDLYNDLYIENFSTPLASSTSAPASIPVYASNELYYYVTDVSGAPSAPLITVTGITAAGVMTYTVNSTTAQDNTYVNVVFVVK